MDGLMFALFIILTICFVVGFGGYYFEAQNKKILEETERLIRRTNNDYMDSYYKSSLLRMEEIEKNILTEIACLTTKNNNDIKEIKDKITTGKKSKRISQLVDENNKLKEENKKLKEENEKMKEENTRLKEKNNTYFYVPPYIPSYAPYSYNPYTGVINNMCCSLNNQNKYEW